jgi:hypothetical protein
VRSPGEREGRPEVKPCPGRRGKNEIAVVLISFGGLPAVGNFRCANNPGAISFCLHMEFHAKIAE